MSSNKWTPELKLDIMKVINYTSINGLHVGSSTALIHELLGEPELPIAKINKKSKILYWLYGNVSILSENDYVIAIDVDFHSKREQMVTLGKLVNWGREDWLIFAKENKWDLKNISNATSLINGGIIIGLSQHGKLDILSLR